MHTDHSSDCATPVEVLLATARDAGLGAIAVTDHNEISGAHDARAKAAEFGVKVIVAEEVKTADQGEVIGLFIEEKIPRGMTLRGDDRRDQAPGRPRLRAAPVRPHALGARLRAPARGGRGHRRDRGLQPARGDRAPSTRRPCASRRSTASWAAPARTRTCRRASAPSASGCATSTVRRSSSSRCATPTSSASRSRSLYVQALKFLQTKATPPGARDGPRAQRRVREVARNQ